MYVRFGVNCGVIQPMVHPWVDLLSRITTSSLAVCFASEKVSCEFQHHQGKNCSGECRPWSSRGWRVVTRAFISPGRNLVIQESGLLLESWPSLNMNKQSGYDLSIYTHSWIGVTVGFLPLMSFFFTCTYYGDYSNAQCKICIKE